MKILAPPKSIDELLSRAQDLAGLNLADVAAKIGVEVPKDFKRQKGWTGQLIESFLGASAGSKPQQDFVELGIELKTLPLSYTNTPLETTYVCYAPLLKQAGVSWDTSNVKNKLQKVLWVPVEGERDISPADRVVGSAILWQPNEAQNHQLQEDWEELMELIALGQVESITARIGQVLQLRPKAANGKALTEAVGIQGEKIMTRPRGFYLRKNFTQEILSNSFM